MRIAMIGQKGLPTTIGGVERHVQELATRLVKFGFDVTVYARKWYTGRSGQTTIDGVRVVHLPSIRTKHMDTITHTLLATIHAIKNADVLHYHGVGPSLLAWIPRLIAQDKKVIVTFHCIDRKHAKWGFVARLFLRLGEWCACKFAHTTIAVSPTIYQYIQDQYNRHAVLITSGVPLYEKSKSVEVLEAFGLKPKNYVLAVSRLIQHKSLHTLIAAWIMLKNKNPNLVGDKKLVIAGDGHYTEKYEQELKTLSANDESVVFTGIQTGTKLAELFSHAEFLAHASLNEGMPISVLEAMSYGLPVLASDILEHRDIISNKEMLFKAGNAEDLMEKLSRTLRKSAIELDAVGAFNRGLVEKYFNWDSIITEIARCYAASPLVKTEVKLKTV